MRGRGKLPALDSDPDPHPDGTLAAALHPRVLAWFRGRFGGFTDGQEGAIPPIVRGESVLLSAPTGSGKTLAGFLGIIDALVREHEAGTLTDAVRAIYVSPLRALTYDIQKNLAGPLREMGLEDEIRIAMRTGDTPASERARFRRRPPHIFLTTPESLAIVLAQDAYREAFAACRFVVIDELHALAENKRGVHLMVSLERMEVLANAPALCRIGLSATVSPLVEVADYLTGGRPCHIVEGFSGRESIVEVLSPLRKNPYPPAGYTGARIIKDVAGIVARGGTTIIFTNTRSGAENVSHRLKVELPELAHVIETHHSSLDRDLRLEVEDRLKNGELRAVVCSTSLELGIDIGSIDTVVMVSTPKGISRTLQRVGRSGHSIYRTSHGVLCATNINDLIECVVCAEMTKRRRLDPVRFLDGAGASDVAIQHILGMACGQSGITRDQAYSILRRAHPFRRLERSTFDRLVDYLKGGGRALERQYTETFGKLGEDPSDGILRAVSKRVEREYLVNVGTIHAEGMVRVYLGSRRKRLGEVEEGFLKNLSLGDTFVLGGRVVKLVETGVSEAVVELARGLPSVPSWNAHKMPLASGLAREVTAFRTETDRLLTTEKLPRAEVVDWLVEEWTISATNAEAIVRHFESQLYLSQIPIGGRMLVELYRGSGRPDAGEGEGDLAHYFFHSLIGRSANDALSRIVARRLKDAVGGNAMVTIDDYGFLLTLKRFQELGADQWRELFLPENAEADLAAALGGSQLVKWQFRSVAQTGLMVPRNLPGRARGLKQLRWSAEILFRVLGQHEPDHPLLQQAYHEATHTFLDSDTALRFLAEVPDFEWSLVEIPTVSPFAIGLYASKIREGMMMEDPEAAIERLYAQMAERIHLRRDEG